MSGPAEEPASLERAGQLAGHYLGAKTRFLDLLNIQVRSVEIEIVLESVPELMDVSKEPKHILEMYGAKPGDGSYASNCLLARRLAERGVRFIHLYHRGWDHHGGLVKYMNTCCGLTDKPTWALIQDLKQRDMLDDTLVIWGGEFGRTPMFQGKGGAGRDHYWRWRRGNDGVAVVAARKKRRRRCPGRMRRSRRRPKG